jgi:ankyrin repeat protein
LDWLVNDGLCDYLHQQAMSNPGFIWLLADAVRSHCFPIVNAMTDFLNSKHFHFWDLLTNKNNVTTTLLHVAIENASNSTPAAFNGTMEALIEAGHRIDAYDGAGYSALHQAVINGQSSVVQCLLSMGANVTLPYLGSFKNYGGKTPRHIAAQEGYADIATLLSAYEKKSPSIHLIKK